MARQILNGSSGKMILNGIPYFGVVQKIDEVVEITSYTKNISPSLIKCSILKVNHRIVCNIFWDGSGLTANAWNNIVTLNASDVSDVTEWSYNTDSYTGAFNQYTGYASRRTVRYNPTTRAIQMYGNASSRTNVFLGLKGVPIYNPVRIKPTIVDSSVCSLVAGGECLLFGDYLVVDTDIMLGSGATANAWKSNVISLCDGYTLTGGRTITGIYSGGTRVETSNGALLSRDFDVGATNGGKLNLLPFCSSGDIWKLRFIFKVTKNT